LPQAVETRLRTNFGVSYHKVGEAGIQISNLNGQSATAVKHGDAIASVLTQLRKPSSPERIIELLDPQGFPRPVVAGAIEFLTGRGFLVPAREGEEGDPLLRFVAAVHPRGVTGETPSEALGRIRAAIVGEGTVARAAAASLSSAGTQSIAVDEAALEGHLAQAGEDDLVVVCSDHDDFETMRRINRRIVAAGARGYFIRMSGTHLVLGPYVIARQLPCFGCYADRLEANITFIREFRARTSAGNDAAALDVSDDSLLMGALRYHIALDLAWHRLGRITNSRLNEVRDVDLATGEVDKAPLLPAPRCEACGSGREADVKWAVRDLL
jgi:bacteriocin biosynthesis cyclodehydratase domain-containing protein